MILGGFLASFVIFALATGGLVGGSFIQLVRFPDADQTLAQEAAVLRNISEKDTKLLVTRLSRLKNLSASADEASRSNHILHIAIMETTESQGDRLATIGVDIDVSQSGNAGLVIVTDRLVHWKVLGASHDRRAKLAFESAQAFDITNAPPRLLAGFRVGAFGASGVAGTADYLPGASLVQARRFCDAMDNWVVHFSVRPNDVRIWRIKNPSVIHLLDAAVRTDQNPNLPTADSSLHNFCQQVSLKQATSIQTKRPNQ
jgi:hypothetical protein